MFDLIPEPLAYANRLFGHCSALSQAADSRAVAHALTGAVAELSGCELVRFYQLDGSRCHLKLMAQSIAGDAEVVATPEADHSGEQLLQFALRQNRTLSIHENDGELYDTGFLPSTPVGWHSLLCQPLSARGGQAGGLLLIAAERSRSLDMFAPSLAMLGEQAISQMALLQGHAPSVSAAPRPAARGASPDYGLIGRSTAMSRVRHLISKALDIPHTVLLTGETGTGKEVVSRAIHECGGRAGKAFVVQNCAAFPEALLESELFGYRKGAFTGATADYAGLFETANGGTLMLDEIGDMPLALQAKLLRVLQEGENPAARFDGRAQGRCAHHRRDAPRPSGDDCSGALSGGPLLPDRPVPASAAGVASTRRRRS